MIYIIEAKDADKIDFDKCLESSIDTLQYSIDGQKTYISATDIDALNDVIPLEEKSDYSFTRNAEWWRESYYAETL